jgi:hypothetical protein
MRATVARSKPVGIRPIRRGLILDDWPELIAMDQTEQEMMGRRDPRWLARQNLEERIMSCLVGALGRHIAKKTVRHLGRSCFVRGD